MRWMTVDPGAAITWVGSLPLADQQALSYAVAHQYANRDPRGAFEWAMSVDPKIRERLLSSVFISIDDATIAEQLFRSIDDPELRVELAHALSSGTETAIRSRPCVGPRRSRATSRTS